MSYTKQQKCPQCNSLRDANDVFCGNCGIVMREAQTQYTDDSTTVVKNSPSATIPAFKRGTTAGSYPTLSHEPRTMNRYEKDMNNEQWMELRWFIFALGMLSLFSLPLLFFFQAIPVIVLFICLGLASVILGCLQSSHLHQWYWFASLLVFGPLASVSYGWFHPQAKQGRSTPPRQLIMIILWLGLIWFGVYLVLQSQTSNTFVQVYLWFCIDLLFAGTTLAIIRALKLKHLILNEYSPLLLFLILPSPLIALIYVMSPNSKEKR